ncbi:MAG: 3'-5' exonuclease [Oscillospiraceae bacterium]|nr:3'-5' exonuclease [Oscillospiraceae bacterium]
MERYIAFDVETPNSANDRMSAIGVAVVEGDVIVQEFYSLIDPECHFDYFNVALTGITPEAVQDAPTFPEVWETLEPLFSDGVLIAHNAPFDMSVLAKCLGWYGVAWRSVTHYACTCRMGRRCYPELPNHRLNTLCDYLDIPLDHHNAGSDSRACAQLLLHYRERGLEVERFLRAYDLRRRRTLTNR